MGIILEIIFNFIIEAIFQIIFEVLIAFGYESLVNSFTEYKSANKYLGLFGCLIIGGIVGLISFWIYPRYIFNMSSFHGISLIVSPVVVGLVMKKWGEIRMESNKRISILSTFWGGAIFAFAYSLVRFLLIK